ncbi:MAG: hypothetical protein ABSF69_11795 [Polyangiaceae bacterium]|jgi:hypothetical protein
MNPRDQAPLEAENHEDSEDDARAPYEKPRLTKKRSVARVTLFSGHGAIGASGLTSS